MAAVLIFGVFVRTLCALCASTTQDSTRQRSRSKDRAQPKISTISNVDCLQGVRLLKNCGNPVEGANMAGTMRSVLLAILAVTLVGCRDTIVINPTAPTPANPATPPVVKSLIEFRVTGNPTSVRVRYSAPADGLTQITTTLPYANRFTTTEATLFLSLEATPTGYGFLTLYPFLAVQILVDGTLFREATSNELILTTLVVSGTWRR